MRGVTHFKLRAKSALAEKDKTPIRGKTEEHQTLHGETFHYTDFALCLLFFVLSLWSMYILFPSHSPLFKCIRNTLKKFHFAFRLLTLLGTAHRNVTSVEVVSQL